jgi:hypothetical protein
MGPYLSIEECIFQTSRKKIVDIWISNKLLSAFDKYMIYPINCLSGGAALEKARGRPGKEAK